MAGASGAAARARRARRTPGADRALYDLLMLRHAGRAPHLLLARAEVDRLRGTTDIVGLRDAALREAQAALEIAELLPPPDLIDPDDLEDP